MQIRQTTTSYNFASENRQMFKGVNYTAAKKAANFIHKTSDRSTSYIALGLGKLASFKPVQSIVNYLKNKNYQEHLAAFVGVTLSGFYMLDTAKSKAIEKDQKLPLILNMATVCAFSTLGAYTLNHWLNKKINHIAELFYIAKIKDPKLQDKFLKFKADPNYADVVKRAAEKNPSLKSTIKSIADKFEFTNNTVVFIKEELKKAKDDKVAADFLKQIKKGVELNGKDKSEVLKEMFLSKMKNSKSMQKAFNREFMNNAIKKIAGADKTGKMTNLMNGFKTAQALMVFALIYRFVSPVIATPIANYVSEKLETKKHQKALTQAA